MSDLWPIIVAVLGPMLLCVTALARYQHLDNTKTRKMITDSGKETRKLITDSEKETRKLITDSGTATRKLITDSGTATRKLITDSGTATRKLITGSNEKNRDLIERTRDETRDLIEKSSQENRDLIRENRRLIEKTQDMLTASHSELSGSLADTRERLARIEGYLRIPPAPHQDAGDGNAEAA